MASQEPDRGSRRRWFRLPGQQTDAKEPRREEPEALVSSEQPFGAPSYGAAEPETAEPETAQPETWEPQDPTPDPVRDVVAPAPESEPEPYVPAPAPEPEPGSPDTTTPSVEVPAPQPEPVLAAPAVASTDEVPEAVDAIELPRIISIANQKGGVGKTTTAVNLGAALAELGFRVLVVDLDPQGNATTGLGISHRNVEGSIYDVIMNDTPLDDCVEPTSVKNLFVCPATIDLAGAEIELVPAFSRELKLKRALQGARDDYDFTLIDCPPSLGLLTVNGLAASDDVLVPIQCEYYALEGLGQLLRNVALVKSNLNPDLDVRGIVLTMYDARTRLAVQVEREVREHFGSKVYRTVVPRTVRISEAPSFGEPIIVFDATSRGSVAYRELAKEVSRGATRRAG
jgi:chromosome partitioning protein